MTLLYRSDLVDSPKFGRGTFWTMRRASAEFIAQVEAATPILPPARLYEAEVTIGDLNHEIVDDLLRLVVGKPMRDALPLLRDGLLGKAGARWTQFTHQGEDRSWEGAILYLGDEPVPARPVPPEE